MEQEIIAEWGPSLTSQLIKNLKKVFGGSRNCFVNHGQFIMPGGAFSKSSNV
jgi:hypothetical protein